MVNCMVNGKGDSKLKKSDERMIRYQLERRVPLPGVVDELQPEGAVPLSDEPGHQAELGEGAQGGQQLAEEVPAKKE